MSKKKLQVNKFKKEDSFPGLGLSIAYIVYLFGSVLAIIPMNEIGTMSICDHLKYVVVGTLIAIFIMAIYIFLSESMVRYLIRNNKRNRKYTARNAIGDTIHWVNKTVDLIMSVLIPGVIALFYFKHDTNSTVIEMFANLAITSLLPTMALFKLIEYGKVIACGIWEMFKLLICFLKDIFETIYIIILISNDKRKRR